MAHVAAHKAAMSNDVLGDICIASRTVDKCDAIIESVQRRGHLKNRDSKLFQPNWMPSISRNRKVAPRKASQGKREEIDSGKLMAQRGAVKICV